MFSHEKLYTDFMNRFKNMLQNLKIQLVLYDFFGLFIVKRIGITHYLN